MYNPAVTGKGGDINFALSLREQWIGFQGTSTQMLKFSSFAPNLHSGFGVTAMTDAIGIQRNNNFKFNYAYFVRFYDEAFLSLGIGAGVVQNTFGKTNLWGDPRYDPDEAILVEPKSRVSPDFDIGIEFNTPTFELGGAVTHVVYQFYDEYIAAAYSRPMRNFYVYSRTKIPLNKVWDFIPGITWHNNARSHTFEGNLSLRYNNNFCINIAYRNPMSVGAIVGINISETFRLMYSYDYGFDTISAYNNGTHEVTISYNIPMTTTFIQKKLRFFRWKIF
jgi:type IX secretion system PorP/SprF family membrane protein